MVLKAPQKATSGKKPRPEFKKEVDMAKLGKALNPYVGGALAGLLAVASVWITGKFFGASTTFVRAAGFIEKFFNFFLD